MARANGRCLVGTPGCNGHRCKVCYITKHGTDAEKAALNKEILDRRLGRSSGGLLDIISKALFGDPEQKAAEATAKQQAAAQAAKAQARANWEAGRDAALAREKANREAKAAARRGVKAAVTAGLIAGAVGGVVYHPQQESDTTGQHYGQVSLDEARGRRARDARDASKDKGERGRHSSRQ